MIQLRNVSRITEAINAFKTFVDKGIEFRAIIKICKSEAIKTAWVKSADGKVKTQKRIITKPRYREIMFPITWLNKININKLIKQIIELNKSLMENVLLKKSICKYMERHFDTNTHSMRYALINHLIYVEKRPITDVAKFVGHRNVNQLVTYTQQKNTDQIFDLDI